MSMFFRRLSKSLPAALPQAFRGDSKSSYTGLRLPYGAIAAISGGVLYFYDVSSPSVAHSDQIKEGTPKVALGSFGFKEFKLQEKRAVTHNTQLLRFSLDPSTKLGLHPASFVLTRARVQDAKGKTSTVMRPYTPISDPDALGYFDLLIKVYPNGQMSQHMASLKPGDAIEVQGPMEKFKYVPNMKKHIGMIAGGTGITPMLQMIETILRNPDDNTKVSLIFSNKTPDDILVKEKLDMLATNHPNFKVFYTVSKPTSDWTGGVGHVSKDMIVKELPGPSNDILILVCGPPGFMQHVSGEMGWFFRQGKLSGLLKELGYKKSMVQKF